MTHIVQHDMQSPFDQIKQTNENGREFWSARDLQPLMGYSAWRNFMVPINRAMQSAMNQNVNLETNFAGSRKITSTKPQDDFELSRYAAYLVAMNGDPNKPEVAGAQSYFAIQTHVAETQAPQQQLSDDEIMHRALEISTGRVKALEAKVEQDAPKVTYVDEFIADNDHLLFRAVASNLGVGEMALRWALVYSGWIYHDSQRRRNSKGEIVTEHQWAEYANKKDYFFRSHNHQAPLFKGNVRWTLKVTAPGASAIARLVKKIEDEFGTLGEALPELEARYNQRKRGAA